MRVLVTGGAGFIGSHLVDRLIGDGCDVVVVDNCSTGSEDNLAHLANESRLRFVRDTILNDELVRSIVADVDLVYHLAAAVGVPYVVADPLWTITTNVQGTEVVMRHAAERGVRVLFASTSEIYGTNDVLPFREDADRVVGPTWIDRWSYSTSKALDEHLCFAYAKQGLPMSIVRYFNVYGPRMDPAGYGSVIAKFLTQALTGNALTVHGDGEQSRCFAYVSEAVDATVRAATVANAVGEVMNIGSSNEITVNELAAEVLSATGSSSKIEHVPYSEVFGQSFRDTRRRVPDIGKANDLLGWRATIPLEKGLKNTLDGWQVTR